MRKSSPRPKSLRPTLSWLLCFFLVVSAILAPYEAAYAAYDGVRKNIFSGTTCDTTDGNKYLAYDPFGVNVDFQIELTNPTCIGFIAASGMAYYLASKNATAICQAAIYPPNFAAASPNTAVQATDVPYPNPTLPFRILSQTGVCASMIANTSAVSAACAIPATAPVACPNVPISTTDTSRCCATIALYLAAVAAMYAALAIIHGMANQAYHTGKICGSEWYGWEQLDNGMWIKAKGSYQKCLINLFTQPQTPLSNASGCGTDNTSSVANKNYREYIYGGVEKIDNGNDACTNPTTWSKERRNRILGYDTNEQRYYMTGPGMAPSYACHRFLAKAIEEGGNKPEQDQAAMQKSYACCKSRSQNAVCIESEGGSRDIGNNVSFRSNVQNKFCTIGSKCENNGIYFEAYASTEQVNYACVKTYSSCPYNHLLGGGTEKKEESGGNLENFCQFLKHCSKLPILPYVRTSNLTGGYIDSACRDMKGDSQNYFSYQAELLQSKTTGFTAPIVQCFKETMQNIFLNKAGHTECLNPDEPPDQYEYCSSGYKFRKGLALTGDSFFIKIQKRFQLLIKMVLTISVTFYGVMILLAVPKSYIERKNLFPYVLKLALICYFTLGTGWQDVLIRGVLEASGTLAAITFKPDKLEPSKLDGCQFPRWNYADDNDGTKYNSPSYPPGKEYLEVWDILDCKIAKAIGFGPSLSVPNLIFMILGGFFTGGLGIVFVIAAFFFAFFLIIMTIRALQFFLVAMTSVIILMYVSVFIIPLCLFNRTKGIFNNWWKKMLGFILQPMILFAYLGILIAIFDNVVIGSATFTTTGTITKNSVTNFKDIYGQASEKTISCNSAAENDSIYCIFKIADIKTYTGFEALGIGLPILGSMNASKLITIIKGALLMYIFSKFMDKIAEVAATLVGGSQIANSSWSNNFNASKAYSTLRGIQTRGMSAMSSPVKSTLRKAINTIAQGNKSEAVINDTKKGGSDSGGNRIDADPKKGSSDSVGNRIDADPKKGGSDNSDIKNTTEAITGGGGTISKITPDPAPPITSSAPEPSPTSTEDPAKETRDKVSDPEETRDKGSDPEETRDKGSDPEAETKNPTPAFDPMAFASEALAAAVETVKDVVGAATGAATEVAEAAKKTGTDIYSAATGGADNSEAPPPPPASSGGADNNPAASTSEVAPPPPPPPPASSGGAQGGDSGGTPSVKSTPSTPDGGNTPASEDSKAELKPNTAAPEKSEADPTNRAQGGGDSGRGSSVKSNEPKSKGKSSGESRYMFSTKEGVKAQGGSPVKSSSVKSNTPSKDAASASSGGNSPRETNSSSGGNSPRENNSSRLRKEATEKKLKANAPKASSNPKQRPSTT
jgi:hypothetical protein